MGRGYRSNNATHITTNHRPPSEFHKLTAAGTLQQHNAWTLYCDVQFPGILWPPSQQAAHSGVNAALHLPARTVRLIKLSNTEQRSYS